MAKKGFSMMGWMLAAFAMSSGVTPMMRVVNRMKRRLRQSTMTIGIKSRLKVATSAQEVVDRLKIAAGFHKASDDTRRKWAKIGNIKLKQFSAEC